MRSKLVYFMMILLLFSEVMYANVLIDGFAYLINQNNHEGITVKLQGTQSYTQITNANGYFKFPDVVEGTYDITYSKPDFETLTVPNRAIFTSKRLSDITLKLQMFRLQGNVSGLIPRVLDSQYGAYKEYLVTDDLNFTGNVQIEAGVVFNMDPQKSVMITVEGLLKAIGTPDLPIRFTSAAFEPNPGDWRQIYFGGTANNNSVMENCIIEYASTRGSIYMYPGGALFLYGSSPTIKNCIVHYCSDIAVYLLGSASTVINNVISENGGTGIINDGSSGRIYNNLVLRNSGGGISSFNYCSCEIVNNTVAFNNSRGIETTFVTSDYVFNNIIYSNNGEAISSPYGTASEIKYNCAWGNLSLGIFPSGEAGNIALDPLFVNAIIDDYHLQESSPCIDSGNPDTKYNDPEDQQNPGMALWPAQGTVRNDMGAYGGPSTSNWIVTAVKSEPESLINLQTNFELFQNYPNPFNGQTTIKYQLFRSTDVSLAIYNVLGELVKMLVDEKQPAGYYTLHWNGMDEYGKAVSTGVYFYTLKIKDSAQSRKLLLIR